MTGFGAKEGYMIQEGKIVIITDASQAAAKAIADRLEAHGAIVVRNYPRRAEAPLPENKLVYNLDTCVLADMQKLFNIVNEKCGGVDYLVHTDNVIFRSSLENISEEDFKQVVDMNAKSAFITTKVFGEHAPKKGGAILYLSSVHDEKPTGCAFTYSIGKGAVKMLCKEMALFFGRRGTRVNLIEMDCLKGEEELLDSIISQFHYDSETKIPLGRRGVPEDISSLAEFLLSDEAAYINGAEIRVDGGHILYHLDR
jgi:glucose 1-dehydrogenase